MSYQHNFSVKKETIQLRMKRIVMLLFIICILILGMLLTACDAPSINVNSNCSGVGVSCNQSK